MSHHVCVTPKLSLLTRNREFYDGLMAWLVYLDFQLCFMRILFFPFAIVGNMGESVVVGIH